MKSTTFKRGLEKALLAMGFRRSRRSLLRRTNGVTQILGFQKGFGDQWFINVGIWIHALGEAAPDAVEQSHLYFRLERLIPELRETILGTGALSDDEQSEAYRELVDLLPNRVARELEALATEAGLRAAMARGRLASGLLRKEARAYLEA